MAAPDDAGRRRTIPGSSREAGRRMGRLFAGAFPVLAGMEDRVRGLGRELAPHREGWHRLGREAGGYTRYGGYLRPNPQGWTGHLQGVNGIDHTALALGAMLPPPEVLSWRAE